MKKSCLMKKTKVLIGVDLSLTSPAVCVFSGEEFDISSCKFFYLTDKKKYEFGNSQICGEMFLHYDCDQRRYDNISNWILNIVQRFNADHVFIEDYSFGSTGRVFNIAENCGLLKHKLWFAGVKFTTIPPTVIKKNATGKGSANKEKLQEHFIAQTGIDIKSILAMTEKQWNPSSDIIDSYFICKCGHDTLHKETGRQIN